jgi:Flp pilus assembly protein TadD
MQAFELSPRPNVRGASRTWAACAAAALFVGALGATPALAQAAAGRTKPVDPAVAERLRAIAAGADADPGVAAQRFDDLARETNAAPAAYNAGVLWERAGRYADAQRAYRRALEIDAGYFPAVENLANLAVRQKDAAGAESLLLDAIKRFPGDLELRNRLIAVWLGQNKAEAAETEAKKILKADERNVGALVNLATVFFRRAQFELATSVLNRAREVDPKQPMVWINLGFVYLQQKDSPKAVESFKRATELRGDLPEAHNNLGALYVEARDYEAAIQSLRTAIALYPTFANAYANLGNAYKGNKQYKEAEDAYKRALELDPGLNVVRFNLGVLHLDNQLPGADRLKRFEVAKAYLTDFLKAAPNLPSDEAQRVQGYAVECDRAQKREEGRIKSEERKARQKAKQDAKAAEGAKPGDAKPGDAKPGDAKPGDGAKPAEGPGGPQ